MKKVNYPLLLGTIVLLLLLVLSFAPQLFTSRDPIHEEPPRYIEYQVDGELVEELSHNPMRPNTINIMGTDDAGRDIYARLVYGTRNTMRLGFLIALFRMAAALPLGIAAGMGKRSVSRLIRFFSTFFSAVPMLIFSFIVLNFSYFYRMQMEKSIVAFSLVLAAVGWSKLAGMIEDVTRRIMEEDFIEGEIAIGKTKLQIVFQNVLPHVIPSGVSMFFKEMALGLFLVAQLAVLQVFVGSTREPGALSFRANYRMGLEPEWGGMLSRITAEVMRFETVWWVAFFPVLFFSVTIMGINLLGEGLRMEFQKRTSRVISMIRKGFSLFSPRFLYLQIKEFKKYYRQIGLKFGVVTLVLLYFFVPRYQSIIPFDTDEALVHVDELSSSKYRGRVSGTEGGHQAGKYIIENLEREGYEISTIPMNFYQSSEERSADNLKIMAPMTVEEGQVILVSPDGKEETYRLHEDFTIFSLSRDALIENEGKSFYYEGMAVHESDLSSVSGDKEIFPVTERYIRELLSYRGSPFREENMRGPNRFGDKDSARGFQLQFMLMDEYESPANAHLHKVHTIFPFKKMREKMLSGSFAAKVSFSYPELPEYEGRIIEAFLPGQDKTADSPGETIVIGAVYDGIFAGEGRASASAATPAATALEIARELAAGPPLKRSVSFVFWDNQIEVKKDTALDGSSFYHQEAMRTIDMVVNGGYYYYEVDYAGLEKKRDLALVTFPAQGGRKPSYLIGTQMEKLLKDMKVPYRRFQSIYANTASSSSLGVYDMVTRSALNLRLNAFFTVGVGQSHVPQMATREDIKESLNMKNLRHIGQVILDSLTMNPYLMDEMP